MKKNDPVNNAINNLIGEMGIEREISDTLINQAGIDLPENIDGIDGKRIILKITDEAIAFFENQIKTFDDSDFGKLAKVEIETNLEKLKEAREQINKQIESEL